ncbi:hypothetical protein [Rhodococcus sp. (in: high G+C Gram-positive bacteria)]|uniref:hypothetical protein n=1 Tax=Rhodococcus sp. TaxID=1831 RepID=UPI002579E09A|nr:hypothetical protein [Rhodococcus sp. (in: high G+C Gram-positive bacteria)]MBQ9055505.1 DUF1016 family protein [Rhodococcus sp. (in: high G+C Gram-positive bacteria)]
MVFELKVGLAEPEHSGKLNFYVNVVDDQLANPSTVTAQPSASCSRQPDMTSSSNTHCDG